MPSFSKHRLFCILTPLLIATYVLALRTNWFDHFQQSFTGKHPLYSAPLDLRTTGTMTWEVPKEGWTWQKGQAPLSLALNLAMMREIPQDRNHVELRMRVAAYGVQPDGTRVDRLVKDSYYKTDEPFTNEGRALWESWGGKRCEFGLGCIWVEPAEQLLIEVTVTTPDPMLATGNPRLRLIGRHDSAFRGYHELFSVIIRDGGLALCLVLLVILAVKARKGKQVVENRQALPVVEE